MPTIDDLLACLGPDTHAAIIAELQADDIADTADLQRHIVTWMCDTVGLDMAAELLALQGIDITDLPAPE